MDYKEFKKYKATESIKIYNCDCMDLLRQTPDNYYNLALVDPPYGLGKRTVSGGKKRNWNARYKKHKWDNETPKKKYFKELFRVSKNQIIWGGNYFDLPPTREIICWDKKVYIPTMSRIEMAWTSFDGPAKLFELDNNQSDRIHPTQKNVALYKWLLDKYAEKGDKILDTHLGSGSIAIACHDYGFELTACELDKDYFNSAKNRIKNHIAQQKLF